MKILSQEANIGTATTVSSATAVRLYNSDSSVGIVTRTDSSNSTIGNFTVPAGEVLYLQKKSTDKLVAPSTVLASKVAYSHMMSYASYSSGGGGGGFITSNLVLHLDASNSSSYSGSGTTWTDLSDSGNNGTLTNGPTFDSSDGGSIVFDGANDRVQFGSDILDPNSNFTITAWVNFDDLTSGTHTIVSDYSNPGSFQFRYSVNHNGVQIVDSNIVNVGVFSSSNLSAATWYQLTVTRSSNTYTLYINGSSNSSFTSTNVYDRGPQTIGANYYFTTEWFDGKIAQVFAYSSALSASEVTQNYNATKSNYV